MMLNRRYFLILLGASTGALTLESFAFAINNPILDVVAQSATGTVQLPPLPYAYDALEPYIDATTMQFHHDKHHAAYVNNLNKALDKYPELKKPSIESLLKKINQIPSDIRTSVKNNGGGHVNHTMFWQIMKSNGGGEPTGAIANIINKTFGSFADFKKQFNEAGAGRFGSGWVWLVRNKRGNFEITTTANQDSPLMEGIAVARLIRTLLA
ncbi:superoxide dismutase [Richelia sinica FACHB-800]|uniref:Superoxide dismutase n=1 Tax=Richelia sinica FACHB-800 TaxID=1357546 RepID=A0A975Y543_9NOST|nr:superoxide dismutase [Richelia sinica]MBD2666479.1 superoxide dismutase [Richelia sinica FACHB-800]QXE23832.1 superoxide dismutase [Richelia sinica FACHB-800]